MDMEDVGGCSQGLPGLKSEPESDDDDDPTAPPPIKVAKLRGTPALPPPPTDEELKNANEVIKQRGVAVLKYAERVENLKERLKPKDEVGRLPSLIISNAAAPTAEEISAMTKAVVHETGAAARTLNRRGARAAGLADDQDFEVYTEDGKWAHVSQRAERGGRVRVVRARARAPPLQPRLGPWLPGRANKEPTDAARVMEGPGRVHCLPCG